MRTIERSIALDEEVEHVRQQIRREPGARVAHVQHDLVAVALGGQADVAAVGCVLGGVVEQVRDHLREPGGIGMEAHGLGRQVDAEDLSARLDRRLRGLDRPADDVGEPHRFGAKRDLPLRDA